MMLRRPTSVLALFAILIGTAVAPAVAQPLVPAEAAFHLEALRVQPAGGTEESLVRSLLSFHVGERIDVASLLAARETLEQSGSFHRVQVHTSRGSTRGGIVLHVEAVLDDAVQLETGFGHDPLAGWYLNLLGVRWNNPLEQPGSLRLGARLGQRTGELYLDAERRRLGGHALSLRLDVAGGSERWLLHEGDVLREQEIDRGRLRAGLTTELTSSLHATVWLGFSSARPQARLEGREGAASEAAGRLVPAPGADAEVYADAQLDLAFDRRDPVQPWRQGTWAGLRLRGSRMRDAFDIERRFWRASIDAHRAIPIASSAVALRARGVYNDPAVPYHLRAVVGGTGSIRGFRDASLSGALGARALWQATAEWRLPIRRSGLGLPRVTGILFADVGDHWDDEAHRNGVSVGAGYGLRVRVPWIQVFGIDVGIPLMDELTSDPFWVHGTLGFTF